MTIDPMVAFVVLMALALIGATVVACITRQLGVFWFPVILLVCYLSCEGHDLLWDRKPAQGQPAPAATPSPEPADTGSSHESK